jgi:hypothetical protein
MFVQRTCVRISWPTDSRSPPWASHRILAWGRSLSTNTWPCGALSWHGDGADSSRYLEICVPNWRYFQELPFGMPREREHNDTRQGYNLLYVYQIVIQYQPKYILLLFGWLLALVEWPSPPLCPVMVKKPESSWNPSISEIWTIGANLRFIAATTTRGQYIYA